MVKNILRRIFIFLHVDLTKNIKYDRLTQQIMADYLQPDSNCIDIGAHRGEILTKMLELSPRGQHLAFEPIPELYANLVARYGEIATILPYALSDSSGSTTFQLVKNAQAYSGLKKRKYDIEAPIIEEIPITMKTLDEICEVSNVQYDFVKIDVEGGEMNVLLGAKKMISKSKPLILFECGKGGIDCYGFSHTDVLKLFEDLQYRVYTLDAFIRKQDPMNKEQFAGAFESGSDYYFVAQTELMVNG